MSILALYEHMWWDAPGLDDEDDQPAVLPELVTLAVGFGWWSASAELPDQN
jgi:hypothetical protein